MPANKSARETPRLSEAEWEVIKPLWKHGPMAARDIYKDIPDKFGWAYKTVKTMLARLVKKGAVTYDQIGNSYLYRPVYSREEMTRSATGTFIQRVFDGAWSPLLAHFVEHVNREELEVLKRELARLEKKEPKNRGE
ncbi:MAG: BlaI/MecI/CopY family transcriptional regulator [Candidatus Hydrogenedentes bacterium]|nr:BlaI/MecI/CopY family transcriptional regulator [Candidatus Hydrogenedentota bacterium]